MVKTLVIGLFMACLVNAASLMAHIAAFPRLATGHSHSKNGVAELVIGPATSGRTRWLAYDPVIHAERPFAKEALADR